MTVENNPTVICIESYKFPVQITYPLMNKINVLQNVVLNKHETVSTELPNHAQMLDVLFNIQLQINYFSNCGLGADYRKSKLN